MTRVIAPDGVFDSSQYYYSQARIQDGTLYVSGQVGMDPDGHAPQDVAAQTRKAFENIGAILDAVGEGFDDVAKITSYFTDMADQLPDYREVWAETFDEPYPCHTAIGIDHLSTIADGELLIEIEAEVPLSD